MLAILISWIAISIVFLTFGDFFVFLYNRLCKQDEKYGITDTFLLGMCFTVMSASISSLYLPSNQYILFAYLILSISYWIIRRKHFMCVFNRIKSRIGNYSAMQLLFFIIPVISLMIVIIWQVGVFDSLFYHQQNIRWNEEYAVVPGLGNFEHRFAFNSNYLLLSAIFSFRFLFGEAVYGLHVLVLVYVLLWIIREIIQSGYEVRRIILLALFTGYIFIFGYSLAATSTDAIPNIVAFYLIAKMLLYPNRIKECALLYVILPITLITFKISILPLALIFLYIFIYSIKGKNYKAISFSTIISFIIIGVWLIRNVIISGYLVFPFAEIDIFSIDWKIPKNVAIEERDFILSCGIRIFNDIKLSLTTIPNSISSLKDWSINFILIILPLLSPIALVYSIIRKKYMNKMIYFVYIILLSIWIIWYAGGPDPRFIGGVLLALAYYIIFLIISTKEEKRFRRTGMIALSLFTLLMIYWPIGRTIRFSNMFNVRAHTENTRSIYSILYRQYPYRELLRSNGFYKDDFSPYYFSNGAKIYISKSWEIPAGRHVAFDSPFPCTVIDEPTKYQDVTEIETRGNTLQDGFRPKR